MEREIKKEREGRVPKEREGEIERGVLPCPWGGGLALPFGVTQVLLPRARAPPSPSPSPSPRRAERTARRSARPRANRWPRGALVAGRPIRRSNTQDNWIRREAGNVALHLFRTTHLAGPPGAWET